MQKILMQNEEAPEERNSVRISTVFSSTASFLDRLTPNFAREARHLFREAGFRAVVKRYGWKFFAAFFAYYLVRDSIIYLLIPYLLTKGLLS